MRRHVLLVLFVFLMSLFTSTFVSTLQESDDNSDESTTVWSRQRRGRCPFIRDSLANGWVRMRNRGRIAKFMCNKGFDLIGNRISTCIQGKWNYPLPVCATRGCQMRTASSPYRLAELFKGSVLEMSCEDGFSFSAPFSRYRLYCNGIQWRLFGSDEDLSKSLSNQYQCKKSDTSETESYFITSEEISTISPLKGAVTAKSETTTNSKFNSKMPEMTAMFVSPVININSMPTESTSLFADKSKTPITESIDKSYTSSNATNIIQEVSTLTTTTTIRLNTLQTQLSSTETTPKIQFTPLFEDFSTNDTNIYTTKLQKVLSINSTQSFEGNISSDVSLTPLLSSTTPVPVSLSTSFPESKKTRNLVSPTTPVTISATIPFSVSTTPANSMTSTPVVSLSTTLITTSLLQSKSHFSLTAIKTSTPSSTLRSETTETSNSKVVVTANTMKTTEKRFSDLMVKSSSKYMPYVRPITTESSISMTTDLTKISSTNQTIAPKVSLRSNHLNKTTQTTSDIRVTTALKHQNEKNYSETSHKRLTTTPIPIETYSLIGKTTKSLSSSVNPMNYSLLTEKTTITPLRRRRQFSTKTSFDITSKDSKKNNTKRVVSISVAIISMTILVTILSLYLIKKRKNSQQNRLSDDSEMRYLSSNEVF